MSDTENDGVEMPERAIFLLEQGKFALAIRDGLRIQPAPGITSQAHADEVHLTWGVTRQQIDKLVAAVLNKEAEGSDAPAASEEEKEFLPEMPQSMIPLGLMIVVATISGIMGRPFNDMDRPRLRDPSSKVGGMLFWDDVCSNDHKHHVVAVIWGSDDGVVVSVSEDHLYEGDRWKIIGFCAENGIRWETLDPDHCSSEGEEE